MCPPNHVVCLRIARKDGNRQTNKRGKKTNKRKEKRENKIEINKDKNKEMKKKRNSTKQIIEKKKRSKDKMAAKRADIINIFCSGGTGNVTLTDSNCAESETSSDDELSEPPSLPTHNHTTANVQPHLSDHGNNNNNNNNNRISIAPYGRNFGGASDNHLVNLGLIHADYTNGSSMKDVGKIQEKSTPFSPFSALGHTPSLPPCGHPLPFSRI